MTRPSRIAAAAISIGLLPFSALAMSEADDACIDHLRSVGGRTAPPAA